MNKVLKGELLFHPEFGKPFILNTDASNKAIGFSLYQEVNGELRPILYGGRVLTKAEKNYATTDKELLACYFAVKKCEFYLLGNEFAVYTDHKPLIHLGTFKNIVQKRFRWIEYLESLNAKIFYIPGKDNIVSDFISRNLKEEKVWKVIEANVIDLEFTNYNKSELLEEQMNDDEIREVINILIKIKIFLKYIENIYQNFVCSRAYFAMITMVILFQ